MKRELDKQFLIEKYLEVIKLAENRKFGYDWEDSVYHVEFWGNKESCEIKFCRRFLGLFSYIDLRIGEYGYSYKITRKEYKLLKTAHYEREEELKRIKLQKTFVDYSRDKKIIEVIGEGWPFPPVQR
jgi:hypothetical protein